jgi:hypothetical protein
MTPEERAETIRTPGLDPRLRERAVAAIVEAIRAAVLEEREACARIAESTGDDLAVPGLIRDRTT